MQADLTWIGSSLEDASLSTCPTFSSLMGKARGARDHGRTGQSRSWYSPCTECLRRQATSSGFDRDCE